MRKNDNGKFIYLFVGVIGVLVIVLQLKTKIYASELDSNIITSSMAENMSDDEIISALISDEDNVPDPEIIDGDYIDENGVYRSDDLPLIDDSVIGNSVLLSDSLPSSYDDSVLLELLEDIADNTSYLINICYCSIILVCLFSFVEIYRTSKMIRKKFLGGEN